MKLMKNGAAMGSALCIALCMTLGGCEKAAVAGDSSTTNNDNKGDVAQMETDIQKASYLIGFNQAQGISDQTQGVLDLQAYAAGVNAMASGEASQLAGADEQAIFGAFQTAIEAKQAEASAGARVEGDAFRAAFAAEEGSVELPSGLVYQVMTEGTGPKPSATDTVTTHYHGTLMSGEVFDSSVERNQPASFAVNGVIAGWTEALQLMGVGSKWKLVIPPNLAYGERGAGGKIGPHETLVFEVELLSIQ